MTDLRIATQIYGDVAVLQCVGRIVFGDEAVVFRERVRSLLTGTGRIVVNLVGVEYMDSGGIGTLVGLLVSARQQGGDLKLVAPAKRVLDALRQTNLSSILAIYHTDQEAIEAFIARGSSTT